MKASDVVAHRTPPGSVAGNSAGSRGEGQGHGENELLRCCWGTDRRERRRRDEAQAREMGCGWGIDRREQQRVAERGPARARRARGKSAQHEECGRARKAGGAAHASGAALMWQRFCVCSLPRARSIGAIVRIRPCLLRGVSFSSNHPSTLTNAHPFVYSSRVTTP